MDLIENKRPSAGRIKLYRSQNTTATCFRPLFVTHDFFYLFRNTLIEHMCVHVCTYDTTYIKYHFHFFFFILSPLSIMPNQNSKNLSKLCFNFVFSLYTFYTFLSFVSTFTDILSPFFLLIS